MSTPSTIPETKAQTTSDSQLSTYRQSPVGQPGTGEVRFIDAAERPQTREHRRRSVATELAHGGFLDVAAESLQPIEILFRRRSLTDAVEKIEEHPGADPAGRATAARLFGAECDEKPRQRHRTIPLPENHEAAGAEVSTWSRSEEKSMVVSNWSGPRVAPPGPPRWTAAISPSLPPPAISSDDLVNAGPERHLHQTGAAKPHPTRRPLWFEPRDPCSRDADPR